MATKIDDLYADISIRGVTNAMGQVGAFRAAWDRAKATTAGGIVGRLAMSNWMEAKSLLGAGGITGLIGAGTIKAAADLEKARLGLQRFVDSDFKDIADGIDRMSLRIPIAVSGLYDIASGAAQVGVQGKEGILAFTEVVAKLATVSNMSFNETAKDLAKLHNVFGLQPQSAFRTANVVAGLSAASAADPGELITTTRYLSGAASTIKFTLDQTIALAAAIKDAGISSEVGGTAFNKLILDMAKMPNEFAKITGMTKSEFQKLANESPVKALLKALRSIAEETSMEDKIAKSEAIGVESVRQSGALLQLIKALELFESHLQRANEFGDKRTELDKQFNRQAESTYSKLQKLGNAFMQLADFLGSGAAGGMGNIADQITAVIEDQLKPGGGKKLNWLTGQPVLTDEEKIAAAAKAKDAAQNAALPITQKQIDAKQQAATQAAVAKAQQDLDNTKVEVATKEKEVATLKDLAARHQKSIDDFQKEGNKAKARGDFEQAEKFFTAAEFSARKVNEISGFMAMAERGLKIDKETLASKEAALAKANDANKSPKDRFTIQEGGRKFAFDRMMDPQGYEQFRHGLYAIPKDMMNSDAFRDIEKKMIAAGGANVAKNATEDQIMQLAQKRGGAIGALASAVAQERVGRLYAKPTFRDADAAWKQYAAGGVEGDPMTRILRENARTQKEIEKATKEVGAKLDKGFADIKNNVIVLVGD